MNRELASPTPPAPGTVREVLVLRALALGDLLTAVPFFRAIRARYPRARIRLLGLPWAEPFVRRYRSLIDGFEAFPGWPGVPEVPFDARRTLDILVRTQRLPPDLAIQAQGSGAETNAFMAMLAARHLAGFVPPGRTPPPGTFVRYPGRLPEVQRLLQLSAALGATEEDAALEWPVTQVDEQAAREVLMRLPARISLGLPYAIVHPGASRPERRWPHERFGAVVARLSRLGLPVLLTGTADEAAITARVAGAAALAGAGGAPGDGEILDLAGRTSLGALGALIERAALVVTNDTGVSHLADAVRTPSVIVYVASDPRRWAPRDRSLHVVVAATDLRDRCARSEEPGHGDCAVLGCLLLGAEPAPSREGVPTERVQGAIDELLGRHPVAVPSA